MYAGTGFLDRDTRHTGKPHVWFLLTEADQENRVLAVMLVTRRRHSDGTTAIQPGEHPFVTAESVISYGETKLIPLDKLQLWLDTGRALPMEPLSPELLSRIGNGLRISGFTPNWVISYLDR